MTRKFGFTLIELLVVIAIIAILAAIAFPVFMKTKDSAYRSSDIANMNAIRNALTLYRADQGAYPPAILGYATLYASGPNAGQVIPADQLRVALYPKRIDSIKTLQPSYDKVDLNATTVAVWPNADPRPVGTAPIKDSNGDGNITPLDDLQNARQAYGTNMYYTSQAPYGTTDPNAATALYKVSGYDVSEVQIPPAGSNATRWELRYALRWTTWGMTTGDAQDDPRQLVYTDPPDDTVVTWNSWFRQYTDRVPDRTKKDLVLFLAGGARPYDSRDLNERSWRVVP